MAVVAETRELARDAADLVEVEYEPLDVIVDARRAQDEGAPILHEDAGTNVVWSGTFDWGDVDGALKAADQRREDQGAPLRPLLLDAARVLGRARRARPRHRPVHAPLQPPDARRRGDLDGPGAARPARQAPLRHAGHRRRLRQQDHDAHVPDRLLPARAQAEAPDPVDGVAHRPAHGERARQRALVPRHRGRRPERRDDARLQGQGARRLRRVPALRAARLHHLGAGHARALPLAQHPRRLHAGRDEQVAGRAEPRLLADAAALADRADLRHRRPRARARPGRGAERRTTCETEEMPYETPNGCVYDSGRLRALPRHRARADRLRRRPRAPGDRRTASSSGSGSARRSTRARTTSASRRSSTPSSSSPGTTRWRRSSSTSSARSCSRSAPSPRGRATRRLPRRSPATSSASHPTRSTSGPATTRTGTRTPASPGRTRASSPSPGSRRSRARPRSSRSRSAGSRAACSAASTRTTSSSRAASPRSRATRRRRSRSWPAARSSTRTTPSSRPSCATSR